MGKRGAKLSNVGKEYFKNTTLGNSKHQLGKIHRDKFPRFCGTRGQIQLQDATD
jgi:hypothetical protein